MKATFMHERQGIRCLECNEFLITSDELEYINPKNMITDPVKEHWASHIQAIEKSLDTTHLVEPTSSTLNTTITK